MVIILTFLDIARNFVRFFINHAAVDFLNKSGISRAGVLRTSEGNLARQKNIGPRAIWLGGRYFYVPIKKFCCLSAGASLTLRVAAVAAEVAAGGVLQLAVTFGASPDHVGHDGPGRAEFDGRLRLTRGARRVGLPLQAATCQHDALGHG